MMLALLLLAMDAVPQGRFSADDLAARVAPHSFAREEGRVRTAAADLLRAELILDFDRGWLSRTRDEQAALRLALGPTTPELRPAIQWLLIGARPLPIGIDLIGYYNPLADVWLVTRWRFAPSGWRVDEAFLVPGIALRPARESSEWTEAQGSYGAALRQADARAVYRFSQAANGLGSGALRLTLAQRREDNIRAALAQIAPWLASLRRFQQDRPAWTALHAWLSSRTDLPPALRTTLIPVGTLAAPDGTALILMSPRAPSLAVLLGNPSAATTGGGSLQTVRFAPDSPAEETVQ